MATPGSTQNTFWNSLTRSNRPLWQGVVVPDSDRANHVFHGPSLTASLYSSSVENRVLPGGRVPITLDQSTAVAERSDIIDATEGLLALLDKVVKKVKNTRRPAVPGRSLWPDNYVSRPVWPYNEHDDWQRAVNESRVKSSTVIDAIRARMKRDAPPRQYYFEMFPRSGGGIRLVMHCDGEKVPGDYEVVISPTPEFRRGLGWERYVHVRMSPSPFGGRSQNRGTRMIKAALTKILS